MRKQIDILPGLLNHRPVDQLDCHSPIWISILKIKNTGDYKIIIQDHNRDDHDLHDDEEDDDLALGL